MSADSWTACPRCLKTEESNYQKLVEQVAKAYGKVSREEWEALNKRLASFKRLSEEDYEDGTFREDYEFYGAETGTVTASYSGYCTVCGLSVTFEHKVPIPGLDA